MKSVTTYVLPSKPEFYVSSHAITSIAVSRSIRHGNEYGSTLAERRSCSQPPRLLLASKKGPTRSVISEHALDGHDYHSSPPSPLPLAKRKKEGLTAQLSRFDGSVKTIDPSESQDSLRLLDDATKSSEHRVSGAHQSKPSCSKGLLSPINFGSQLEKDEVDPTVTTSSQVPNGSKYQYYPPTNPSNGRGGFAQSYDTGPRRQLSYSDLKPRSLHKSTGSTELRREAEWSPERSDSSSWLDDSPNAFATRLWDSEPSRPKPRLRLDLTEDGGQIKEAVSL